MKTQLQTKKLFVKLMLAALSLIIVVTMTVSVSYAWLTLSKNPSVSGAQIAISGGNTILIEQDIKKIGENGETVHYPGAFSDSLTFSGDTYAYLSNLAGLRPISTADGVYWIAPTSDNEYMIDGSLANANLDTPNRDGSYIYVDFWVVSPGSEYKLRVSSGGGSNYRTAAGAGSNQGSSLVDMPNVIETSDGYSISDTTQRLSPSVRVGFLVNSQSADNLEYPKSSGYEERYSKLVGRYQEPGEGLTSVENKFTIYEPNGTVHTADGVEQGSYVETKPFRYNASTHEVTEADIRDILTVQTSSNWIDTLDQFFQTYVMGNQDISKENAMACFISERQAAPYITAGSFFTKTRTLYDVMDNGVVSSGQVEHNLTTSGATDDVYITMLQRNTPQRIRMFIWVEGQDIDCADSNSEQGSFVLNLELAGANN